ncbi:MAG: glycosyltransferase family 9 protein [Planctomycetota bacterium]|jgi:ADP-heptose:LPS heptosyltransferase
MEHAIFLGFNALGDTLCTTPSIRAFRRMHADAHITYIVQNATFCRLLDDNPHIDLLLYSDFMYLNGLTRFSKEWLYSLPLDFSVPATLYTFDINQVCTSSEAFEKHIAVGFANLLRIPIENIRPEVVITPAEKARTDALTDKPYVVVSMHSNANPVRKDGNGRAKEWPQERWEQLCQYLRSEQDCEVLPIGSEFDTQVRSPLWRNLNGLPIKLVASLLRDAACVITLENGIGHLCHAVDAPTVMIYSNVVPLGWANPLESTNCQVLYGDPKELTIDEVIAAVGRVMGASGGPVAAASVVS